MFCCKMIWQKQPIHVTLKHLDTILSKLFVCAFVNEQYNLELAEAVMCSDIVISTVH